MHQIGMMFSIQLPGCVAALLVVPFRAQPSYSANVTGAMPPMQGTLFGFGAAGQSARLNDNLDRATKTPLTKFLAGLAIGWLAHTGFCNYALRMCRQFVARAWLVSIANSSKQERRSAMPGVYQVQADGTVQSFRSRRNERQKRRTREDLAHRGGHSVHS